MAFIVTINRGRIITNRGSSLKIGTAIINRGNYYKLVQNDIKKIIFDVIKTDINIEPLP